MKTLATSLSVGLFTLFAFPSSLYAIPCTLWQWPGSHYVILISVIGGVIFLFGIFYRNRALKQKLRLRSQQIDKINTQLEQQYTLFRAIFADSPEVSNFSLDHDYCYLSFNKKHKESIKEIFGTEIRCGMSIFSALDKHQFQTTIKANCDRVLAGESFVLIDEYKADDESSLYWQGFWSPTLANTGKVKSISCFMLNISELIKAEKAVKDSAYLLRESERVSQIGSFIMNYKTGLLTCSEELHRIIGIDKTYPHSIEGWYALVHPDWRERVEAHFQEIYAQRKLFDYEYPIRRFSNGEERWIHGLGEIELDSNNEPLRMIGTIQDVTTRKDAQDKILYLSYHDQLTGLYNRRYYEEELKRLDVERNYPLTLVMADVNGLKLVNDSFGHSFGDELLKKVAEVMRKACRGDDIIARLGGDEFIILLPNTDRNEAEKIVKRIHSCATEEKIGSIEISISFGYETKYSCVQNIEEVLKKAEDHMYTMKLFESPSMRGRTVTAIARTLNENNKAEDIHSKQVSDLCVRMGEVLGLPENEIVELKTVGLLHDIGKIAIDGSILTSPTPLDNAGWGEVKRHSEIGYRILRTVNDMAKMAEDVLAHHERWDGQGYPKGIKAEQIPLFARIIAIADSYDAMTNERSYREAISKEEAIEELRKNSGTQFDPELVQIFIEKVIQP